MKIANSRAALRRFDKGRFGHPELPADPGTVHALFYVKPGGPLIAPLAWRFRSWNGGAPTRLREPHFIDGWHPVEAACGARVRTVLPRLFDTDDDACPKCVQHANRWREDPAAYICWIEKRYEEHQERKQLNEDLREFRERQARELG
jgi:hypothetical protein